MSESHSTSGADAPAGRRLRILLIEDDVRWRSWVEINLETAGHEVRCAPDGLAGLEMAVAERPDLVLCDIEMPRLNGFGVLESLRRKEGLAEIPLIFLTSRAGRVDQRKGMALGADDYLTKPFTREELLSSIAGAMTRRGALAERVRQYTDEHRRELAAPWAHELLTPLNGMLGIAAMIEAEAGTIAPDELRELARAVQAGARRQQELAQKLVRYFRLQQLEDARWDGSGDTCDGGAVIADEAAAVADRWGRRPGLQLQCAAARVAVSEGWMRAAVAELVENAIKFSSADTPLVVAGRGFDGLYRVEVTDRGRGMTPEMRAAVGGFRQFHRPQQEQQGLGLGLAIARAVARLHRGSFGLDAGAEGVGLRATLEFPLAD